MLLQLISTLSHNHTLNTYPREFPHGGEYVSRHGYTVQDQVADPGVGLFVPNIGKSHVPLLTDPLSV